MTDTIAILIPTRERPHLIRQAIESAYATAAVPEAVEFWLWVEDDDPTAAEVLSLGLPRVHVHVGDKRPLGQRWTDLAFMTDAPLVMLQADHIVFKTQGWDEAYRATFEAAPDKLVVVHANDGFQGQALATSACVHRRWLECLGYFTPVMFRCWFFDTWLTEVADILGRRRYLADVLIETLSPEAGNREADDVWRRKRAWLTEYDEEALFARTRPQREADAAKLRALMVEHARTYPATVEACLIVKDEKAALERCIASLDGWVDAIHLTCTDPALAHQPLRVGDTPVDFRYFPWCDHFAAARNASLEMAQSEWVLFIDADEVLTGGDRVRQLCTEAPSAVDALLVPVRSLLNTAGEGTANSQPRLFRRAGMTFRGRIHEQIARLDGKRTWAARQPWVGITHHGYMESEIEQAPKMARNRRLLRLAMREEPDNPIYPFQYARQELRSQPARALVMVRRALALWEKGLRPEYDFIPLLWATAAAAALNVGRHEEAVDWYTQCPRNLLSAELLYVVGEALAHLGRLRQAEALFRRAHDDESLLREIGGDEAVYGWKPLAALAELFWRQAQEERAA